MRSIAFAATLLFAPAVQAEQIWLTMDHVRPFEIKSPAGKIIVGNPGIADVNVQDKNNILLFGKAPGVTNIYIMDEQGNTIDNLLVKVESGAHKMLTVHKGSSRQTFNCMTICEPTVTVGDEADSFDSAAAQNEKKLSQAMGNGK